jgi:hypothetical protein
MRRSRLASGPTRPEAREVIELAGRCTAGHALTGEAVTPDSPPVLSGRRSGARPPPELTRMRHAGISGLCDPDMNACRGTLCGHRRVNMSADVLQWSLARPGTPPAGPGLRELLPPQSLVTAHASAPATGSRVATASRRKVVGVDCVSRFIPFCNSSVHQGASRVRPPRASGAGADRDGQRLG